MCAPAAASRPAPLPPPAPRVGARGRWSQCSAPPLAPSNRCLPSKTRCNVAVPLAPSQSLSTERFHVNHELLHPCIACIKSGSCSKQNVTVNWTFSIGHLPSTISNMYSQLNAPAFSLVRLQRGPHSVLTSPAMHLPLLPML